VQRYVMLSTRDDIRKGISLIGSILWRIIDCIYSIVHNGQWYKKYRQISQINFPEIYFGSISFEMEIFLSTKILKIKLPQYSIIKFVNDILILIRVSLIRPKEALSMGEARDKHNCQIKNMGLKAHYKKRRLYCSVQT